jgi:hypothetical protein
MVTILGLADQQSYVRQPRAAVRVGQGSARRVQAADILESALWERATQRLGAAPERDTTVWVRVGDRGADIYNHLRACQAHRHRFLVRAKQDRVVVRAAAGKLFAAARASASLGVLTIELRARPGSAARTATVPLAGLCCPKRHVCAATSLTPGTLFLSPLRFPSRLILILYG